MYIYGDFVVDKTRKGNFKVVMYSSDEDARTIVRISRDEVEELLSDNIDDEMIAILIAIIRFMRIYSFKENSNEEFVADITKTKKFKRKLLSVLDVCSIEHLIETFEDVKYSEIVEVFDKRASEIIEYIS